jgi:GTP cyclohydrolase II
MNGTKMKHRLPGGDNLAALPNLGDRLNAESVWKPESAEYGIRTVHRAAAELRRGSPVLLTSAEPLFLLAAETTGARGLIEFDSLIDGPPTLLLAPVRAAAVLHRPLEQGVAVVALHVSQRLFDPASLRALADPTVEQLIPEQAESLPHPPIEAASALALAKIARLLPAVLAAKPRHDAAPIILRSGILAVAAGDVLAYPAAEAAALQRVSEASVPLDDAPDARIVAFRGPDAGIEHLAIVIGDPVHAAAPLVRVHSECFTGDVLGSLRCDCGEQLRGAIRRMGAEGAGVVLYLAQEGRGIGLVNKLRAYTLQDAGLDTLDANRALGWGADERNFMIAASMLRELGVDRIRLLTNNPDKLAALAACGITVIGREQHVIAPNGVNDHYLETKARRLGHLF